MAAPRHVQLSRHLVVLHAINARIAGYSLRETADLILGPADWPDEGDHRKSMIRQAVRAEEEMVRTGPISILQSSRRREFERLS